ncbi:MAG TPA: peptide chain release factor N(5)-glutamine methyltransferase [Longimicrobiaceae bacterium]|nr:peptide chain release factor N(5)-glutamine methyltransferase [Longimicrobiaceae bacterium]
MRKIWTVLGLLRWTAEYLAGKGIEEPRLNAELLLAGTLGLKRLDLYLQFDRPLREEELAEFKARLLRRARREPLQYIAGTADFRELRLRVDRRVLIPRPETEVLVGEVLRWAGGREDLSLLDVGTGSGAIALSAATEGPFRRVVAVDVSEDALAVARENHCGAAPGAPVEFRLGSLFDAVAGECFDVVVSNPPYVGESERASLQPEVRDWEPEAALFAGAGGLDLIEPLVAAAPDHLNAGGLLALEIGATQAAAVAEFVRGTGAFAAPTVRRDLAGRDRIVLAERR